LQKYCKCCKNIVNVKILIERRYLKSHTQLLKVCMPKCMDAYVGINGVSTDAALASDEKHPIVGMVGNELRRIW